MEFIHTVDSDEHALVAGGGPENSRCVAADRQVALTSALVKSPPGRTGTSGKALTVSPFYSPPAVLRSTVPKRPSQTASVPAALLKPLVKPIVKPVLERLDKHEEILLGLRDALDVQFKRIAQIQAQLDQLIAAKAR
jgi:hypothetical protein